MIWISPIFFIPSENEYTSKPFSSRYCFFISNDLLPGIVKLKADSILKEELKKITDKASVVAEYIPRDEKDYIIKCKIIENNEILFEVRTTAGSHERAKKIVSNWQNHASTIYPTILDLLISDE